MAIKNMYYTISEAAEELDTSRQTIYRWIANNKIPTEKIGGVVLIEKTVVDKYAEDRFMESMMGMFDRIAFDALRQQLGYTDKDHIERFDNEGEKLVFLVTHEDGTKEKVLVGYAEFSMAGSPGKPFPEGFKMKIKFTDITREDYAQSRGKKKKKRSKS